MVGRVRRETWAEGGGLQAAGRYTTGPRFEPPKRGWGPADAVGGEPGGAARAAEAPDPQSQKLRARPLHGDLLASGRDVDGRLVP